MKRASRSSARSRGRGVRRKRRPARTGDPRAHPLTLAIDIGGSHIKGAILDREGRPITERVRVPTPEPSTPIAVSRAMKALLQQLPDFDRASIGFPGVIVDGRVLSAANLHPKWVGEHVVRRMRAVTGRPTRVANDADIQGLGVVAGKGTELVLTLGTGVGSALFLDGRLIPNLELGHHPFRNGDTYEDQLGDQPLHRIGRRRWNKRLRLAIKILRRVFTPRRIYLGGGNARLIQDPVPRDVIVVSNFAGILGGIRLWE
jgi:polyphosphate glucokinase